MFGKQGLTQQNCSLADLGRIINAKTSGDNRGDKDKESRIDVDDENDLTVSDNVSRINSGGSYAM